MFFVKKKNLICGLKVNKTHNKNHNKMDTFIYEKNLAHKHDLFFNAL
jgi:hypothetical protein